jgi:hypothetical protein
MEGGYAQMARPIATDCKLGNMRKGKECMDNGKYEFGMGEDGTIVTSEGGSEKKKRTECGFLQYNFWRGIMLGFTTLFPSFVALVHKNL